MFICLCFYSSSFYSKFLSFAIVQRTNEHMVSCFDERQARMAAAISRSAQP
jgi:hypothetical protein